MKTLNDRYIMKRGLFLMLMALLTLQGWAQTPQFYNYNNGTAGNNFPFNTVDRRIQWLYHAGEFSGAYNGKITKLYFRPNASSSLAIFTNFEIKLGYTSQTTFTSGSYVSGLTTVLSSASYIKQNVAANGWLEFELDVPFPYDSTKNLVVEVAQENVAGGFGIYNTAPPVGQNRRMYGPATSLNPLADGGYANVGFDLIPQTANEMSVVSIDEPVAFCPGTRDVKATIRNTGTNQVTTFTVNWTVDGASQTPFTYNGLLDTFGGTGTNATQILLGSVNFTAGVARNIQVTISTVNGNADSYAGNNTRSYSALSSISGVFTVGGAGADFANLASAANALNTSGVCGPVELRVNPGTYTGQVSFNDVKGTSPVNTIRVIGSGISNTTISDNSGIAGNSHVLRISNTSYVTVKHLSVVSTSTSAAMGIHITGLSNYNLIDSCKITVSNTISTTAVIGVSISGTTYSAAAPASYNTISNCEITGGYNSVSMYGNSGSPSRHNRVIRNVIRDAYYAGIWMYYQSYALADRNDVRVRFTTSSYGIYLLGHPDSSVMSNNSLYSRYMGIYASGVGSAGMNPARIYNNVAYGQNVATSYNYYLTGCINSQWFNNSGILQTTGGASFYTTGGSGNSIYNNIFAKTNNAYVVHINTPAGVAYMDYNNLYSYSGSNFANYGGTLVTNLAGLKGVDVTNHLNTISEDPRWASTTAGMENLHISSSLPSPRGISLVSIASDIDGDPRCSFAPTLGADENTSNLPNPLADFNVLDSLYENTEGLLVSTTYVTPGDAVNYEWFVDGNLVAVGKNFNYSFPVAGNYTVLLRASTCNGDDTVSKVVTVHSLTRTPVSDFSASVLILDPLQTTQLFDLTQGGADSWVWTADPAFGAIFSDQYAKNPTLTFLDPGQYEICLSTANSLGTGKDTCKKAYIYVREEFWMCSSNKITAKAGRLQDEGGSLGAYGNNRNCSVLIDPCAATVNLKFKTFTLADAGDVLYIYDGENSGATLLGAFSNTSGIPGGIAGLTASSGKMFLVWTTNNTGTAAGFDAEWTSTPANVAAPVAGFNIQDTIFTNELALYSSTSTGVNLNYNWDFDPPMAVPGVNGGKGSEDRFAYNLPGNYNVKLEVVNCVGRDEITRQVTVIDPVSKPIVGFTHSTSRSRVARYITLTDTSGQGPYSWKWKISPSNSVYFKNNVSDSRVAEVIFYKPGFYSVELVATNMLGADSVVKTNLIEIFDYCVPAVNAINNDAGISSFTFNGVTNASSIGVDNYTNYTETLSPIQVEHARVYSFSVERNTVNDDMSRKIWIDWNQDGDFFDAGELIASEDPARTLSFSGLVRIPRSAVPGITRMRVGASYHNGQNTPCGINPTGEFEDYALEIVADVTAPQITLAGQDTVKIEQWHGYVEAGYTAQDNVDGDLTSFVQIFSNLDSSTVGVYHIRYLVSDTAGNAAIERVRVVEITPDVTPAVLTLFGNNPDVLTIFTSYNEPGYSAIDFDSRNITTSVQTTSTINENLLGAYHIDYTVDDGAGNISTLRRTVNVVDNVSPVVLLTDSGAVMVVEVHDNFVEPGVIINDNYDQNPTLNVSGLNLGVTGTYQVKYEAVDSSGNVSEPAYRTVRVVDTQKPELTLIGGDTIYVNVFSTYNERGYSISDNYCQGLSALITGVVNTNKVGDYPLAYNVTDCEGNVGMTVTRLVRVVDRQAPVLTLNGLPSVQTVRWASYTDLGVTISDNYYSENELMTLLQVETNLDTNLEGQYELCYYVTDPSGNRSNRVCRQVEVTENLTSVKGGSVENTLRVYPVPSRGVVTVENEDASNQLQKLEIYDLNGRVVVEMTGGEWAATNGKIDLGGKPAGVYYIRWTGKTAVWVAKVELVN